MPRTPPFKPVAVAVLVLCIGSSLASLTPLYECDKCELLGKKLKRTNSLVTRNRKRTDTLEQEVEDQKKDIQDLQKAGDEKDNKLRALETKVEGLKQLRYKDCGDVEELNPAARSGVYTVYTGSLQVATRVYCDMDTKQGGWTTLLRRFDGSVSFNREWSDLKSQIGELTGEHWIGLDAIHRITSQGQYELLVELEGHTDTVFALYDRFWIEGGKNKYKLHVSGYNKRSTVGDSLHTLDGQAFSTHDADHDTWSKNCAEVYEGAWWYTGCHQSNLLGTYRYTKENRGVVTSFADSMVWLYFAGPARDGYYHALKEASMKVRRI